MAAANRNAQTIPVKVLFPFAVVLLLFMSFLLLNRIDNMNKAAGQVNHTNLVRLALTEILTILKDAEASQRGFLLSKDTTFLSRYQKDNEKINHQLSYAASLLMDNPVQQNRLEELRRLITFRLGTMRSVLNEHRNDVFIDREFKESLVPGSQAMKAVEQQVATMINDEVKLLAQRTKVSERYILSTPFYTVILTLLALLIILLAFDSLKRQLKLSRQYLQQSNLAQEDLQKTNTLFEYAEQEASIGSWKWDQYGTDVMHSKNLLRLFGYLPGEWEPQLNELLNALAEKCRQNASNTELLPQTGAEKSVNEFWKTKKGGQQRYFRSICRLFEEQNRGKTAIGTIQDITEEYLLKQQLQQRTELAETLVESSVSMIAVVDTNMCYTIWNRACEERFGLSKEEVIGRPLLDVFTFVREDPRLEYITAALQKGIPTYRKELPYLEGKRTAEFSYIPLKSAEGKIMGLLIMIHDVTEKIQTTNELKRLNAELQKKVRALRQSESFNRHITDMAPNAIYVFDFTTNTNVYANRQALEIHGYSEDEVALMGGKLLEKTVFPDDLPAVLENHKRLKAASNEDILDIEFRIRHKSGECRHQFVREAVFKRNIRGEVVQIIGVALDITDLKKAQEKLLQLNKELTERNLELQHSNEELASFNYIASHDLQEPLRKIQTFSNFIEEREDGLSPAGRNYLKRMQQAASRMRSLIKDLLTFSRARETKEQLAPVDLNTILQAAQFNLKAAIDEKEAIIKSDRLPVLQGIGFQLQQLFENLIGNAIKYSRPGIAPFISITCERVKADDLPPERLQPDHVYYRLSFKDNGIGFEPEYAERIFELFQRLHSKDEYSGTGIGLAICKKIVQNHGGTIQARSVPEKGATFEVFLPAI